MKRNVRGMVARARADLRFAGVERYRRAVAEDSADVRMYLALAAGLDRIAVLGRAVKDVAATRADVADSAVAVARRLRSQDTLLVQQVAVGGAGEISLSLTGPAAICAAARTVALHSPGGRAAVALPTQRWVEGDAVRLIAAANPEHFPAEGRRWQIRVTDGRAELPVVIPARGTITQRWGTKATWPPRVGLDAERRLTLTGRTPAGAGLDHSVQLGLTSVIVSWPGDTPTLRVTSRADRSTLVVNGRTVDGTCTATLDLLALAARPPAAWDVAARTGDHWRPLQLAPGRYPPLTPAGQVQLVLAGRPVPVQLAYTQHNRLLVRVGTPR